MLYEKIWKKTLNDSEKVEYEFSVAKGYRLLGLIVWGLVGVVLLISGHQSLGFLFILIAIINYWYLGFNAFALTDKRVLIHTGWLSTKSTSINYDKIVEVSVEERFISRIASKSGNLLIKTGGFGHDVTLKNIESPYEVKKTLDRLSHNA